ncbi:MAG: hypothetical protein Q8T11_07205 [Elusimicrobiota bacterium]|nr:hypothetical protein [Elusimicrobiota bacterium]
MTEAALTFFACGVAILAAGTVLTRCADKIAELSGLGRVLVGSVFLAGATSLPELGVGLGAVRLGSPDLAAGDLLGACLMNLLVLAVIDAAGFSPRRAFGADSRHHALFALHAVFLVSWVGLAVASGGGPEIFGASVLSWALLPAYLLGLRMTWLNQGLADIVAGSTRPAPRFARELASPFLGYLAAAAATITALRIDAPDLAPGNVFGSNVFNMLLFLPLDWAHPGRCSRPCAPTTRSPHSPSSRPRPWA